MVAELKPYPGYKDSGVPWLGDVPAHWVVRRIKTLFREREARSSDGTGLLLSLTRARGLVPQSEASNRIAGADDLTNYKACRPGDLVMNRMQAWSGMFAVSPLAGLVSPDYSVFEAIEPCETEHFAHLFRTSVTVDQFAKASKGIGSGFNRLYTPDFGTVPIVIPPLPEQVAIVRFLDHADRRIRRYIRVKQKMISLLEEQKHAIIRQAVTGQIDVRTGQPYPTYKDSGVEWLSSVPAHWKFRRLKSLVKRIDQGVSPQAENYAAESSSWGVLKAGCVNGGEFKDIEHKRLPSDFTIDPELAVQTGDVLVSRASGSPRFVGSVGRVSALKYRLILSDKTFRPVFVDEADPDFMVLAMNGPYYRQQVERAISGAEGLANNLPLSSLRAFRFAIPTIDEQRQVVRYVNTTWAEMLRGAVSRAQREVSLVDEYRTRLIADAVTGKLDVRDVAAKLPECASRGVKGEADVGSDSRDRTR